MKKADSEEPTFHGIINYANNKIHHTKINPNLAKLIN